LFQFATIDALVVDDDEAGLYELTAGLRRAGLVCDSASNGWQALERLVQGAMPAVLVSDIKMPELDGLELVQRVARMQLPVLPDFIFISGNAELPDVVTALRLRARDLLTKPVDLRRLIQVVKESQLERQMHSSAAKMPWRNTVPVMADSTIWPPEVSHDVKSLSVAVLTNLRNVQRARVEHLPAGMSIEASWELLLDLYVSEGRGEATSLTSIGISSGVPLTSALRRINELIESGLIAKVSDEKDKRRSAAHLTAMGRQAVESFVRSYVDCWPNAKLERQGTKLETPSRQS
jgi:CheY-like chemotaxis protein